MKKIYADEEFSVLHTEAVSNTDYIMISISDNGVGMTPETRTSIFDPFFTTKKKEHGTGLGLAIAYNIIKQHNGFLDVYSELGVGTTFHIFFPQLATSQTEKKTGHASTSLLQGSGTILIVDDEEIMRNVTKGILKRSGYMVLEAENGPDGLEIVKKNRAIKAVILDMSMPKMSGLDVYKQLQKIAPGIKVLMTSGFKQDERVNKALELGVNGFLQKPFTAHDLTMKIHEILSL